MNAEITGSLKATRQELLAGLEELNDPERVAEAAGSTGGETDAQTPVLVSVGRPC